MGDRWGSAGPPEEAYSRVTRDLAQVSAGFASYLDRLPGLLTARFACVRRALTSDEAARVLPRDAAARDAYALEPAAPGAAPLLVARSTHDGGVTVTLGFGRAMAAGIPTCFCDACDEDSDSLVEQAQECLDVVTGGFSEFRRPYVPNPGIGPLADGPWLEEGYRSVHRSSTGASADVRGELFEVSWAPWTARS